MKNISSKLVIFFVFLLVLSAQSAFATSGACSNNGGVNCAVYQSTTGDAVCNDGSISSVPYLDVAECFQSSCVTPVPQCSQATLNQIQNSISEQELDNPTGNEQMQTFSPYSPAGQAQGTAANSQLNELNSELANCQSEIILYNSQLQTYDQCISNEQAQQKEAAQQFLSEHPQQPQAAQSSTFQNSPAPSAAPEQSRPATTTYVASLLSTPTSSNQISETFNINENLKLGSSGSDVITLQNFLETKGFLTMPAGVAEGYFGNLTKQTLVSFQKSVGLPATGYCGPLTRQEINNG